MKNKILTYAQSGHPGIYLVSPEETRVEAELASVAKESGHALYAWSATDGLVDTRDGSVRPVYEPMEAIAAILGCRRSRRPCSSSPPPTT
jgi:hypothetical protein